MKQLFGFNPAQKLAISTQVYGTPSIYHLHYMLSYLPFYSILISFDQTDYYKHCTARGAQDESAWNDLFASYASAHPDLHAELSRRISGSLPSDILSLLPPKHELPTAPQPTRKSSGIAVQAIVPKVNSFVAGSADLLESTFVSWDGMVEFQAVGLFSLNVVWHRLIRDCDPRKLSLRQAWEIILGDRYGMGSASSGWSGSRMDSRHIRRACSSRSFFPHIISTQGPL